MGIGTPKNKKTRVEPPRLRSSISKLKPTIVFDKYWRFAAERQAIFFRRAEGDAAPWTEDPILRTYKFTNAYRASDRVSQYLIGNVIYGHGRPSSLEETFFRIILFKLFNKIETWELLEREFGDITFEDYSFKKYDTVFERAMTSGKRIYSAAYIMPSGGSLGHKRKHRNHLTLIERMMTDELPKKLADCESMNHAFNLIRSYPTIGDFLAYQYATDVNYSTITNFTEMEFVIPGPGAIDGIRKCFRDTGGMSDSDIIRMMTERQDEEFERRGIEFRSLWGRKLQLIDCQNLFCEIDKYSRVAHPELSGVTGRTRIKQKFSPMQSSIQYYYPPKWNINSAIDALPKPRFDDDLPLFNMVQESSMDLTTFQLRANKTDRNPGSNEVSRMIPLLGLASETGELLGEYKKYLRDGESHHLFRERIAEEVGDLLWYLANVATKFDLDLSTVAEQNLSKCESRWGKMPARLPFDADFPECERFPRKFSVDIFTFHDATGAPKVRAMYKGKQFGNDVDDNAHEDDGYGYHDVIHLAFAAVLGWSPLVRTMIAAKRKSSSNVDRVEDGGRAIATEEGVSAMIFAYAREYNFFEGKNSVSSELLRMVRNMVRHLEVAVCSTGEWEQAILQGFRVWRFVSATRSGTVDLDLDAKTISVRGN